MSVIRQRKSKNGETLYLAEVRLPNNLKSKIFLNKLEARNWIDKIEAIDKTNSLSHIHIGTYEVVS